MLAVDANQRWDVGEAIDWMARLAPIRPVLDRGADQPRRHPRPRGDRPGGRADPGRHRRARPQPGHVQAAAPGRGDRRLPDRRLPARRRERGRRGPAAGRRVRRAGLPARRRRRPVRARPAPLDLRLRLRQRLARGSDDRVRRPPARALPRSGRDPRRPLPVPTTPGYSAEMRPESLDEYRFPDGVAAIAAESRAAPDEAVRPADPASAPSGSRTTSGCTPTPWPGVLAQIHRSNIRNYSIFRHGSSCSPTSNTSARTSRRTWPRWPRTRDAALVGADRRDAGAAPGS